MVLKGPNRLQMVDTGCWLLLAVCVPAASSLEYLYKGNNFLYEFQDKTILGSHFIDKRQAAFTRSPPGGSSWMGWAVVGSYEARSQEDLQITDMVAFLMFEGRVPQLAAGALSKSAGGLSRVREH